MISALPNPVLSVAPDGVRDLNGREALSRLWTLFTKCKESLENGRRLENISWRLWYRDMLLSVPSSHPQRSIALEDTLFNEKAYRPPTPVEALVFSGPTLGPLHSLPTQLTISPQHGHLQNEYIRKPLRPLPVGQIICDMLPESTHGVRSLAGSPNFASISMSSSFDGNAPNTRIPRPQSLTHPTGFLGRSQSGDPNLDLSSRAFLPLPPLPEHISRGNAISSQLPTPGTERDESAAPFGNVHHASPTILPSFTPVPSSIPASTATSIPPRAQAAPPSPSLSDCHGCSHPNKAANVDRRQALGLPETYGSLVTPSLPQIRSDRNGDNASPHPSDPMPHPAATPIINEVLSVVATPPRLVVVNPTPGPTPHPTPPATPSASSLSGNSDTPRNHGQFLAPPVRRHSGGHLTPTPVFVGFKPNTTVSKTAVSPHVSKSGDSLDSGDKEGSAFMRSRIQALAEAPSSVRRHPSDISTIQGNPVLIEGSIQPLGQVQLDSRPPAASQHPHRLSSSSTVSTISTSATNTSDATSSSSRLSLAATSVRTDDFDEDAQQLPSTSIPPIDACIDVVTSASGTATVPSSLNEDEIASPISPLVANPPISASITSVKSTKSTRSTVSASAKAGGARNGRPAASGLVRRASSGASSVGGRSRKPVAGGGRAKSQSETSRSRSRDASITAAAAGALASTMGMTTSSGGSGPRKQLGGRKGKSRVVLGRTSSKGAGLGGGVPLTRTLSHEDVEEVSDEDEEDEGSHMAVVEEVSVRPQQVVEAGSSKPKFGFGSNSDDGSALTKSPGTEISSRAQGSYVPPGNLGALREADGVDSKGKGREVETRQEQHRTVQDHVTEQRVLAQQQTAAEMQKAKDRKEQKRKMAEAVALAQAQESLADPLLPQGKKTIVLGSESTSESDYTDTDEEDSWTSEEVAEVVEAARPPPPVRRGSQQEDRQQQQVQAPPQAPHQNQHLQQAPQRPGPVPLQRTQSNISGYGRNHTRRDMQHLQQRREAHFRVQRAAAQLQREEEERERTREMFAKRPTSSFQNLGELNRTNSIGLLTQLLNPDPSILPLNHPYRRGYSSGEIPRVNMSMTATAPPPFGPPIHEKPPEPAQQQPQPQHVQKPQPTTVVQAGLQQARPPHDPNPVPTAKTRPPALPKVSTAAPPAKAPSVPPSPAKSERRHALSTNPAVALALRGMRSLGLQLTKGNAVGPVASQLQVGSVKSKGAVAPPSVAPSLGTRSVSGSSAQRQRGPLPGQEMEDTDSEEEDGENSIQLSQSLAQHKLSLFAARQGIHVSGGVLPTQHESDEMPVWTRQAGEPRAQQVQQQEEVVPTAALATQASGPIPVIHPYNLPFNAAPSTPRTTRRQMLRSEMSESLRRQLLWERQQAGVRRTSSSTAAGPSKYSALNPLRPFTAAPSMVQLHAKGTAKKQEEQRRVGASETGAGEGAKRSENGEGGGDEQEEMEEKRRQAMARNRSWGDDYHRSGW